MIGSSYLLLPHNKSENFGKLKNFKFCILKSKRTGEGDDLDNLFVFLFLLSGKIC